MKEYCGAIFTDFDGTLVDERLNIFLPSDKVRNAFIRMREKGYLIGIATGRAKCYVPDVGIPFDCYVSCNGASAEVEGINVFNDVLPWEKLKPLLDYLNKKEIGYVLENADICIYTPKKEQQIMSMLELFHIPKDAFIPMKSVEGFAANKVMVTFETKAQYERMRELFGSEFLFTPHRSGLGVDIAKANISKANGIHAVLERTGIALTNTYAFGDHDNDITMLQTVAHPIAIAPCSQGVDMVVEYISCGVKDDGIYHGLKHFGLL